MKRYLVAIIGLVLALNLMPSVSEGCGEGQRGEQKNSVEKKFFKKIHMIYSYQEELGITEKQLDEISDLKVAFKKDLIKKDADIDVLKVDILSQLYKDKIDIVAVNSLIDRKYELKKVKSKKAVETYAKLKGFLSEEQLDKLKELYREQQKTCSGKGSQKGSRKK